MKSSSRNGARVRVLGVHTTEGIMRAADLRAWTAWPGSSHAAADETGVLLTPDEGFVPYDRAAWTLRSGNPWSENIELCGFAGWTRAQWLARPRLLDRCAFWLAVRSKARGIPLVKLTPQEYRAGKWGVIGHHDHTVGYSDGTHWDPGPGFPWDVVLDKARAYAAGKSAQEEDMTPGESQMLQAIYDGLYRGGPSTPRAMPISKVLEALLDRTDPVARANPDGSGMVALSLRQEIADAKSGVMRLEGREPGTAEASPGALAEILRPVILEAVKAGMAADNADQADEIVDRLAARLGGTEA